MQSHTLPQFVFIKGFGLLNKLFSHQRNTCIRLRRQTLMIILALNSHNKRYNKLLSCIKKLRPDMSKICAVLNLHQFRAYFKGIFLLEPKDVYIRGANRKEPAASRQTGRHINPSLQSPKRLKAYGTLKFYFFKNFFSVVFFFLKPRPCV